MEDDTKFEDRDADNLRCRRLIYGVVCVMVVFMTMVLRQRLGRAQSRLNVLLDDGDLLLGQIGTPARGTVFIWFRTVCGVGADAVVRYTVSVGIVCDAEGSELGGAPAEGEELDDEDGEDAHERDREGVRLGGSVSGHRREASKDLHSPARHRTDRASSVLRLLGQEGE